MQFGSLDLYVIPIPCQPKRSRRSPFVFRVEGDVCRCVHAERSLSVTERVLLRPNASSLNPYTSPKPALWCPH